ncbi:MAG TPA: hypothetical protein VM049_04800 [Gaiellaceae bacterium]|nr:hypothetical protein [Gaiellaceae bacterium]
MRTFLLGLLGLVLSVAVGFGVHLITRGTISLPVVRVEQPAPALPDGAKPTTQRTITATSTEHRTTTETGTEDSSGRGRGRGGSDDSGGNSGRGGGDD